MQDTSISSNTDNISSNTSSNNTNAQNIATNSTNLNTNTNSINSNTGNINTNLGLININIDKLNDMEIGLAQSMAMAALVEPQYGQSNFSIATGNYYGTNAIAYGFSHHDSENDIVFRLIGSRSGNVSSSAGSIGWGF